MSKNMQYLSFWTCLSHSTWWSPFSWKWHNFIFLYDWIIFYHIFFVHSSLVGDVGRFHILAIVKKAAVNMSMQVSLAYWFILLQIYAQEYNDREIGLFLVFLRNVHTHFYYSWTSLYSHHQCMRVPFSRHPCQYLLFAFLMIANLTLIFIYFLCG
jgi:hypothetical protein